MGSKFKFENNSILNTKTGSVKYYEADGDEPQHFAVLAKAGHCGRGYYIPILIPIRANSQELAIEMARQKGRIKSSRGSAVIDVMKITDTERNYIAYINECDRYRHASHNTADLLPQILDRRIAMEQAVDFNNSGERGKIPADLVKTAKEYANVHVLQRYLAPSHYGNKLIYPKSINFRDMLDEFFYYSTLHLGIMQQKVAPLSFYYQLYGPKNSLGIKYSNGKVGYYDGKIFKSFAVPDGSKIYLDNAQILFNKENEKRLEEEKRQAEEDAKFLETKKSATDRFNARFAKYQQIKNSKLPGK